MMVRHRRSPYNFVDGECIDATHDDRHRPALAYGCCRRASAVDDGPVDGATAAVLPARPRVVAGTHAGRVDRVLTVLPIHAEAAPTVGDWRLCEPGE
jgi:hypothetical protein